VTCIFGSCSLHAVSLKQSAFCIHAQSIWTIWTNLDKITEVKVPPTRFLFVLFLLLLLRPKDVHKVAVSVSWVQASEADKGELLCCGKPCHKALPKCPHVCQATCHQGPCPAASAEGCQEEVTVRCSCRRRKTKMSCHQVSAVCCLSLAFCCWSLAFCCWSLAFCCLSLAFCCLSLAFCCRCLAFCCMSHFLRCLSA